MLNLENIVKITCILSVALMVYPLTACAASEKASAISVSPQSCAKPPCVVLNADELTILSPLVSNRLQQLQQEYQSLGAVVQDIQKQAVPQPPLPAKK